MGEPYSLYLHIPFCQTRCTYCDFNAYAGMSDLIGRYARALAKEIRVTSLPRQAREGGESVHTIFFGGGTPSLTPLPDLALIFAACRETFDLTADAEITLEANPGTVSLEYLEGLRALGVTRLSFGVQSAHASELALFNRIHSFEDAVETVRLARIAGFDNVNLDLIFGIPGQTLAMWQHTLESTLGLEPEHLSAYSLSLEFGTPMQAWVQRGQLPAPDPDLAADMYEWAGETLEAHGFAQYEISNWAMDGRNTCRHNLQYWRNLPYLGFGAGAHGWAKGWRYSVARSPRGYIERIERGDEAEFPFSPALAEKEMVDRETEMGETMMLGMRLTAEGVSECTFRERFGIGLSEAYAEELGDLAEAGLIEWDATGARLTRRGRPVANWVFRRFV